MLALLGKHVFLLLLVCPVYAEPPVLVVTRDQAFQCASWRPDSAGGLVVQVEGEAAARSLAADSLTLLDTDPGDAPAPAPGDAFVTLGSGEILRGRIAAPDSPGTLRLETEAFGALRLALDQVVHVHFGRQPEPGAGLHAPCVVLTNGDEVPGTILELRADSVAVDSSFGPVETPLERVRAIVFQAGPPAGSQVAADILRCTLADGQRWHIARITEAQRPEEVQVHRAGAAISVPVSAIRRLLYPGWQTVPLAALASPAVETTSYLGEPVRVEIGTATAPRALALDGRSFANGLTAQARSIVRFELPDRCTFLIGWAGLDPLLGPRGSADLRVETDGEVLYQSQGLSAADGAQRIAVSVAGRRGVSLVTDFGPRGTLGDRANWCDMALLAPLPAPAP